MARELQLLNHPVFGEPRVTEKDGEPMFAADDACRGLDTASARQAMKRLDDDEKGVCSTYAPGGGRGIRCVTFPGLPALILGSRKKEARECKRRAAHEVLPMIHKTGGCMVAKDEETPEEAMARALLVAKDALDRKEERVIDEALSVLHDAADVLAGDLEDARAELMRLSVKRASQPLCGYLGGVASAAPFSFPATPDRQLNGRKERA